MTCCSKVNILAFMAAFDRFFVFRTAHLAFPTFVPFCHLLFSGHRPTIGYMLGTIILVLLAVGFYAFIGTAPQEAIQITLALAWGAMLLAALLSPFL